MKIHQKSSNPFLFETEFSPPTKHLLKSDLRECCVGAENSAKDLILT